MADLSRLLTSHWLCKLASFDIYFTGNRISDYASSAPAVVEEEHRPPPSLSLHRLICLHWLYQQGVLCDQKSHTELLHLPDTAHNLLLPYTTHIPAAGAQRPHMWVSKFFSKHAAHTGRHMCARCSPVWLSHTNSQKFVLRSDMCGAAFANTSVLIRLITMKDDI